MCLKILKISHITLVTSAHRTGNLCEWEGFVQISA